MDGVITWLGAPVFTGFGLTRGAAVALAALALLFALFASLARLGRKKSGKKPKRSRPALRAPDGPVTGQPQAAEVARIEAANLQGIGQREEQQDAFGLSSLAGSETRGLLAVLCDGMGGMAQGREISQGVAAGILSAFPLGDAGAVAGWHETLAQINRSVYERYGEQGGTTLVMAYLFADKLWCWSVGDSDAFLLRQNRLYALNQRHEYLNDLFIRVLDGSLALPLAFEDPQRGALSRYIGSAQFGCDFTRAPFLLCAGDALLLCSDGVSDTLSLHEIRQALSLPPEACCAKLESGILAAGKPNQDNYTAIAIRFNPTPTNSVCGGANNG